VQDAFKAFNEFTAKHIELNSRKVLVITGKSGIIKAEFETWAKTNKHIQYFELKNGGGAFSIKFKKY
jgi:DNA-nicking Smr family endonuclease